MTSTPMSVVVVVDDVVGRQRPPTKPGASEVNWSAGPDVEPVDHQVSSAQAEESEE